MSNSQSISNKSSQRFYIQTFGCQMNAADSDLMADYMLNKGLNLSDDPADSDIIVINTCSVRHNAEHKALSYLGRIEPLKEKKKDLKIIFVGCMAERVGERIKKRFPVIDLVIGAKNIEQFPQIFEKYSLGIKGGDIRDPGRQDEKKQISAFVTIIRGCENFCSYCIVPYVRGKEISRNAGEILDEVRKYAAKGAKEITLLGQNVNSYRNNDIDFPKLLSLVNEIDGIQRVRFMTSHPKDLSDKLIETITSLDKTCEHIHLPLQSGSDKILKAMNRKYTFSDYMRIVEKLKNSIPNISFTTDIIVGFPQENNEDFKRTLDAIKQVEFDALFAFKYSPRQGTAAMEMEDNVPREEKEKRLKIVLELADKISKKRNESLLNNTVDVLVEEKTNDLLQGRSRTNKKIYFEGPASMIGKTVPVKLTEARIITFMGKIAY